MNKKITDYLMIGVIIWNLLLSYYLFDATSNKNKIAVDFGQPTPVQQNITTFETDFTTVIENNASKVVAVISNGMQSRAASGVIYQVSDQGVIIVTNSRHIQNASTVDVYFSNGKTVRAEVVGYDAVSDLAVLRVKPDFDVEAMVLGDSAATKIGEWVIALGKPSNADLSGSVTAGILSEKENVQAISTNMSNEVNWQLLFLQVDILITEGSSGGPLLNIAGELVGINTTQYHEETGITRSYAIPINEVVPIVNQILENGKVERPPFSIYGISVKNIPIYAKENFGVERSLDYGVVLTSMTNSNIGFRDRDVILEINGEKIDDYRELRKLMYAWRTGDILTIKVQRNGQVSDIEVVIP